jgi:hypothetical protein
LSPAIVYLAAGDSEEGFWVQLLVVVALAAGAGVYSIAKSSAGGPLRGELQDLYFRLTRAVKSALVKRQVRIAGHQKTEYARQISPPGIKSEASFSAETAKRPAKGSPFFANATKGRDLKSGMELLAREFLVGVAERTDEVDRRDIEMRRLCFSELVRRGELFALSGDALKVYILNNNGLFSKSIQREAMEELAGRTGKSPQEASDEMTVKADREQQSQNSFK